MYPGQVAEVTPDKVAVVVAETGWTRTFAELDAAANRLSHVLRDAGLQPGDHIAICMENHPRYIEILWGCDYAGLIFTAASSRLNADELSYIVNDCHAKAVIISKYKTDQAAALLDTTDVALRLMVDGTIDGYDSFEEVVDNAPATPLSNRIAGTDMLYSSGTTGRPKGIMPGFELRSLEEREYPVAKLLAGLFGFTSDGIYLSPAPMYHAAPLRFCMAATMLGGTVVIMETFDASRYLEFVEKYVATHSQVVPTMFVRMLKLDERARTTYDVSTLQAVVHAAAPCPVPVKRQMMEWFGPIIHEYYAGTEGNGFVYASPDQWLAHPGTVGVPVIGSVHIVDDETNEELPAGTSGTIYFESNSTFKYHNDPEKTAQSRHPNGWSTLGDVGYLDADGFLYLTDRKAYVVISGGVNIYPQEAENVLTMHPKVVDVAVFGVPNDDLGEEVKAVVQPLDWPVDNVAASALATELIAHCRSQIADIKCPRSVDFRPELPRHPTGKLYKRLLKDEYWQAAGRAI